MISEVGSILMLHRVASYEGGKLSGNEDMKISPDELRQVINELKSRKVDFVSLDDMEQRVVHKIKAPNPVVAITLDDGYKDNLEIAYPIFQEHHIPFCIYVTNCFPNGSANLWWYALEELILQNKTLSFPGGTTIENDRASLKMQNFLWVRQEILDKHYRDPLTFLKALGRLDFDLKTKVQEMCMTWEEVIHLSKDPLVTIGAHTAHHFPLSKLPRPEAEAEVTNSKKELQEKIGKPVTHLAFPFGGKPEAHRREYAIAKGAGFTTATTTVHGHVYRNDNLMCLPRIFLRPLSSNFLSLEDLLDRSIKDPLKFAVRVLLN